MHRYELQILIFDFFVIEDLCSRGRYYDAWQLYRKFQSDSQYLRYNTFQLLLRQCIENRDFAGAISVFEDMKNFGFVPNKVTYSMLISSLTKQKRRGSRFKELAYKYWKEMKRQHVELDAAALRMGIKACVNMKRIHEAESIISTMEMMDARPDIRTYNIIVKEYARIGDMHAVENILQRIETIGLKPTVATYNAVIASHIHAGKMDEADKYFNLAVANGIAPDAWTFTSLIKGHIDRKEYQAANTLWNRMAESGIRPTVISYSVMIDGHIRNGNLSQAHDLLEKMIAQGILPSAITFNSLLRGYAEKYESDSLMKALTVLGDMESQGIFPGTDSFNTLMSAAVAANEPELAITLHEKMVSAGQCPDGLTYTILIQAFSRLGKLGDAVGAFEQLSQDRNASMDVASYNAMVDAFARAGEMVAAEKMLKSASDFAARTKKGPPVEAYGAVVTGYVRMKMVKSAVDTVRRFHAAGGKPDIQMLDQLVDVCVRTGEYKVAMQAVRAMELIGAQIDKTKYIEIIEKQERASKLRKLNENPSGKALERFKFWLGLPNSYYSEE